MTVWLARALTLTLIAAIDFGLADKRWRINPVAAQKYVSWVSIAPPDVARNVVVASAVVAVKIIVTTAVTAAENSTELAG